MNDMKPLEYRFEEMTCAIHDAVRAAIETLDTMSDVEASIYPKGSEGFHAGVTPHGLCIARGIAEHLYSLIEKVNPPIGAQVHLSDGFMYEWTKLLSNTAYPVVHTITRAAISQPLPLTEPAIQKLLLSCPSLFERPGISDMPDMNPDKYRQCEMFFKSAARHIKAMHKNSSRGAGE